MKKQHFIFIVFILVLFLSGCSNQDLINDPETGEIINNKPSALQNGNYQTVSTFYDNEGYRSALTIEVHEGVITKAVFTEKDPSGDIPSVISKETDLSAEEIYHQLVTQLIKKQNAQIDIPNEAKKIGERFQRLAESVISLSEEGKENLKEVFLPETYTVKQQWEEGSISVLTVSFDEKNAVTEVKYEETLNDELTESKSYFTSMTEETIQNNNLSSLPENNAHLITIQHYNAMLQKLDDLRKNGSIQ